jgi:hypothetical protein
MNEENELNTESSEIKAPESPYEGIPNKEIIKMLKEMLKGSPNEETTRFIEDEIKKFK